MKRLLLGAVIVMSSLVLVSAASADSITWSLAGSSWSASGTFQASPTAPGTWLITGASGNFNGTAITGVWPASNTGNVFNFNNLYYWPAPVFDINGVVLTLANGDLLNICYDTGCTGSSTGVYGAITWNSTASYGFYNADTSSSFSQPTPEPGTLIMLGSGILGVAGILRRRTM